jgi:DNA-binding ferritin-like protein
LIDALRLQENKNNKNIEDQIRDLSTRFNQTSKDIRIKMYSLEVKDDESRSKLKESILDNQQKFNLLNKDIKNINKKLEDKLEAKLVPQGI